MESLFDNRIFCPLIYTIVVLGLLCCEAEDKNTTEEASSFVAKGVRVDIPLPKGELRIKGDSLIPDKEGNKMTIKGGVSITSKGSISLEANAQSAYVNLAQKSVHLKGGVKASFTSKMLDGQGGRDAGKN